MGCSVSKKQKKNQQQDLILEQLPQTHSHLNCVTPNEVQFVLNKNPILQRRRQKSNASPSKSPLMN